MPKFYSSEHDFTRPHPGTHQGYIPDIWEVTGPACSPFHIVTNLSFPKTSPYSYSGAAAPQPELSSSGPGLMLSPRWIGISLPLQDADLEIHNAKAQAVTV